MLKNLFFNIKAFSLLTILIFFSLITQAQNSNIYSILLIHEEKQLDVLYPIPVTTNELELSVLSYDGSTYEVTEFEVLQSRGGSPIQIQNFESQVLDLTQFELLPNDAFSIRVTEARGIGDPTLIGAISIFLKDIQNYQYANPYKVGVMYAGKDLGSNAKISPYYKEVNLIIVEDNQYFYDIIQFEAVQIRGGKTIKSRVIDGKVLDLTRFELEANDTFSLRVTKAEGINNGLEAIAFAVLVVK